MLLSKWKGLLLILTVLCLGLATGCDKQATETDGKLRVVATTSIIADVVEVIARDRVELYCIIGPGNDPHTYQVSEEDIRRLNSADIVFQNGHDLEAGLADVIKQLPDLITVVSLGAGMKREVFLGIEGSQRLDPHFWFNLSLWQRAVIHIHSRLRRVDTANHDFYTQNSNAYRDSIGELDAWIADEISSIPFRKRMLVTPHAGFEYFAFAYEMEAIGLDQAIGGSLTDSGGVESVIEFLNERKISTVFSQSSLDDGAVESIIEAGRLAGIKIKNGGRLFSDGLGEKGTEAGTYLGMLRHNVKTIVKALK